MTHSRFRWVLALLFLGVPSLAIGQQKRLLTTDDLFRIRDVGTPRISPDGVWVAYTVMSLDAKDDRSNTDIYMAPIGGGDPIQLTRGKKSETSPRWSPDGRYLAFLSGPADDKKSSDDKTQVWLLDRRGGEPVQLTEYKASVSWLAWSPDSTRLALIVSDVDPDEVEEENKPENDRATDSSKERAPKPIVIRRLFFKRDGEGYLTEIRQHVHVFDLTTKQSAQVSSGPYDDESPVWSPDGKWIAFASNRTPEPDSNQNTDIYLVPADGGAPPKAFTSTPLAESAPAFTPDGRSIVFLQDGNPADIWYATNNLVVAPVSGGPPRTLTEGLDRNIFGFHLTHDGAAALFIIEEEGIQALARVPLAGGSIQRVVTGERDVVGFDVGPKGEVAVLESQPQLPGEISMFSAGSLKRVTHVNDAVLSGITLASVERFKTKSKDGTVIDGFLMRPPAVAAATGLPAVLRIHGGPTSQFSAGFDFEWQILAANGYAVIGANPRGSSGRGRDFAHAIWADWGNKDFEDVMAAVDHVVATGAADPERLGVGGWSYGGILTNYVITKTTRFKAATSGASEVNYLANFGHDHYLIAWETELGLPWKATDLWMRLSPYFKVDEIKTPTLVLCGQEDWNVPLINSEQLYQALRRLGIPTELVVYPGQGHAIRRPSYQKDRYDRYVAWYDKYLKKAGAPTAGQTPQ